MSYNNRAGSYTGDINSSNGKALEVEKNGYDEIGLQISGSGRLASGRFLMSRFGTLGLKMLMWPWLPLLWSAELICVHDRSE